MSVNLEQQFVVFQLETEEYGFGIETVKEIVKYREVTKLPHVKDCIEGITNLRGDVIPIICLRRRFGLEQRAADSQTRIIIVDIGDLYIGFIVDAVTEVLRLSEQQIEPPPKIVQDGNGDYLNGVGKIDDRLIILLDTNRLLTSEQLKISEQTTKQAL